MGKIRCFSLVLECFQHYGEDEDEDAHHIPIEIPLEVKDVAVADALTHPVAVMTETLTTQSAGIAVHHRMVHYRSAQRTLALLSLECFSGIAQLFTLYLLLVRLSLDQILPVAWVSK
jgi:hypothetical protein